jgi:rhomboid protease GluP
VLQQTVITSALIGLNVLVWIGNVLSGLSPMNPDPGGLLQWGGNLAALTLHEPWRLLTATFLHAGIIHLALNMMSLHSVGRMAELFYGRGQYLALYLCSGLCGSLASLYFGAKEVVSVGASGAIFGVVGALLAALFSKGHLLEPGFVKSMRNSLLFFTGFSLYLGFVSPNVDNAAHIGGLIAGAAGAWFLPEAFDTSQVQNRNRRWPWLVAATALILVVGLSFLAHG